VKSVFMKVLTVTAVMAAFALAGAQGASADYWGARKFPGNVGGPDNCLVAGVQISTSPSPDKHNAAASNSCQTNYTVSVEIEGNSQDHQL